MNLHPNKVTIRKLRQGIDFLCYVVLPHHRVLRTKTKRRIFKKANAANLQSYLGVLKHCKGYKIKKKILNTLAALMNKKEELEKLKKEMEGNKSLPLYGEANLVFGEGDVEAEVMFIGEGPGFHEDRLVRPFVGQAGKLLDMLLTDIKWPRESVYITNIVKRRPPNNRDPLPEEIEAYKPYLTRQIEIINPKMIVALGRFSMAYFLPDAKISKDHAVPAEVLTKAGERMLVVPLYHPAAALRSTQVLKELEADFQKLPRLLEEAKNARIKGAAEIAEKPPKQVSLF